MKFLVISLMRLNDVISASGFIRNLHKKWPDAQIDLLVNGQFEDVARLIPNVKKIFSFNRDGLIEILNEQDQNVLQAYYEVEDLISGLNRNGYQRVYNLTQNRLSGWLTASLSIAETFGPVFDHSGRWRRNSLWFDWAQEPAFHWLDVIHYASELDAIDRRPALCLTGKSDAFARQLFKEGHAKKVLIHPSFSSARHWLERLHADVQVASLGVYGDRSLHNNPHIVRDTAVTLEECLAAIKMADLVIAPHDSSLKALTVGTSTKLMEVASEDYDLPQFGPYVSGAVIVQAKAGAKRPLAPETLAMVASCLIRNDENTLRLIAHEEREDVIVRRTHINAAGDWSAHPLASSFSRVEIGEWVDRSSVKLFLQKAHERAVGEFGTEGLELKRMLEDIYPERSGSDWNAELKGLEREIIWFEGEVTGLLKELKAFLPRLEDKAAVRLFFNKLNTFCDRAQKSIVFRSYGVILGLCAQSFHFEEMPTFGTIRLLREKLIQTHQRANIELKLVRGLQTDFAEAL